MIAAFRAGVVTLLILLLGSAATLSALATKPSSAVATYPYDGHHASAQVCNDAVERGPPERKSTDTTHAAGDDPSSGTPVLLARAPTTHADFTYDHLPPVVQVASVAPSTERPQSTRLVPISPCARWRVAANAGTRSIDDVLRPGGLTIGKAGTDDTIREIAGGLPEAQTMFQQLSQGGTVVARTPQLTRVELPNGGGFVQLRTVMSRSPNTAATIDVNIPGFDITKLKYNP